MNTDMNRLSYLWMGQWDCNVDSATRDMRAILGVLEQEYRSGEVILDYKKSPSVILQAMMKQGMVEVLSRNSWRFPLEIAYRLSESPFVQLRVLARIFHG